MKRLTMEYEDKRVSLLPCPFCGGDPLIHSYRRHGVRYSVRCGNEFGHCRMNLRTLDYLELEQAVADWNMRPQEPNEPLTLDELREMDGKPVWVKSINDDALFAPKGWAIVTVLDNGDISLSFLGEDACRQTWVLSEGSDEGADEEDEIEAVYRRRPEEAAK